MKKCLLLSLVFLMTLSVFGQADVYNTFLNEGKVWHYHHNNYFAGQSYNFSLFISGDTLIGGKQYKKIVRDHLSNYQYALREENGKVFIVRDDQPSTLLYDFTKKEGETVTLDYWNASLLVEKIDTVKSGTHYFRRFHLRQNETGEPITWIEGIGGEYELSVTVPQTGGTESFLNCELNDSETFNREDFYSSGIAKVGRVQTRCETEKSTIFDLQGQHLGSLRKGLNIVNGKKVYVGKD
jgi:hypothetical protein